MAKKKRLAVPVVEAGEVEQLVAVGGGSSDGLKPGQKVYARKGKRPIGEVWFALERFSSVRFDELSDAARTRPGDLLEIQL